MPTKPIVNAGVPHCEGLLLESNDSVTVNIFKGCCRDYTNTMDIILDETTVNNPSKNGLNGLDSSTLQTNETYYLFVIADSTKKKPSGTIFSLSIDSPLMPAGYDSYNRIGVIYLNSTLIRSFSTSGGGLSRDFWYDDPFSSFAGGTESTFTSFSYADEVPSFANMVHLKVHLVSSLDDNMLSLRRLGSAFQAIEIAQDMSGLAKWYYVELPDTVGAGEAEYKISAPPNSVAVWVRGFTFSIGI